MPFRSRLAQAAQPVLPEARTPCRSEAVYASRLGSRYPRFIVNFSSQKRLSFRLRLSSVTALSSASRFNCAGGFITPQPPRRQKNAFNRRRKAWRRLAFHAKCVSPTSKTVATPALRLSKSHRLLWLLGKRTSDVNAKRIEKIKFAKTFEEIGQDVLFGDTLRLEISRTYGYEKVG